MFNESELYLIFYAVLAGVFIGCVLASCLAWHLIKREERKKAVPDVPRPDAIVTLLYFADAFTEIKATDAMGYPVIDLVKQDVIDRVLEKAGYKKRTTQAVCEASTVLESVSVTVEEPLDAVYPKTPEEAIEGMKARGSKKNAN